MSCSRTKIHHVCVAWGFALGVALALVGRPAPAQAALGDDASAIAADQSRLQASLRITAMKGYAIHELTSPVGSTVRQYVGSVGKVFGVSWSGGFRPNLRDIMGSHYDQFIAGTRGQRRARGPVRVELPGMVVTMGGYLRTFWGHVYLTDLAPAGWMESMMGGTP
jgi:hypothetical protein